MRSTSFHGGYENPYWQPPTLTEIVVEALVRAVAWLATSLWAFRYLLAASGAWLLLVVEVDRRFLLLGLLLLIPQIQKVVVDEWQRSMVRYQYWVWRRNWNRYAMKLGWARHYDHHAHTPDLKSITIDDEVTVVELQPLADHRISMWPEMADALRRLTNHAVATWRETTPGHLEITLHRRPLPNYLPLDFKVLSEQEGEIYLGTRADGQRLVWDIDYSPHVLIAGATGGGKGSVLRLIAAHAIANDWELTIINPKRSGEFHWTTGHARLVKDLDETNNFLNQTVNEMIQRQDMLDRLGVDTWHDQPWQRQIMIIDEVPTLLVGSDQKTVRSEIAISVGRIAAMGRSAGIHLALVAQRADAQALGQHGGQLRNNITARIAVGSLDQQGRQMLFGTLDPDIERTLTGVKGRALATQLTDDLATDIYPAQIAWVEQQDLTAKFFPTRNQNERSRNNAQPRDTSGGSNHDRSDPVLLPHPRPHHQNPAPTAVDSRDLLERRNHGGQTRLHSR